MNHPRHPPTSGTTTGAHAVMATPCELEAVPRPQPPFDGEGSPEPASPMRAVLRMATQVEPDPVKAAYWYRHMPIAEFAGFTAEQLVSQGRASDVVRFLLSVRDGGRD